MSEVFIIDAIRTPIGSFLGQYKKTDAVDLGSLCVEGIFNRNKNLNKKHVEGLILGQVLTAGLGMNTARQVLLKSELSQNSFAYCVNQVCGSGMRAVMETALKIKTIIGTRDNIEVKANADAARFKRGCFMRLISFFKKNISME